MKKQKKSTFTNYVGVESIIADQDIYCPVCGKELCYAEDRCPHLLFHGVYVDMDKERHAEYIHPKFNKTRDVMEKELLDTEPADLASILNLNPESTMILCATEYHDSHCSSFVHQVVIIEFPPRSAGFQLYKDHCKKSQQERNSPSS